MQQSSSAGSAPPADSDSAFSSSSEEAGPGPSSQPRSASSEDWGASGRTAAASLCHAALTCADPHSLCSLSCPVASGIAAVIASLLTSVGMTCLY